MRKNEQTKPKIIGIAGAGPRTGCTHLSLVLTRFLKNNGYKCALVEHNVSGHLYDIATENNLKLNKEGSFKLNGCDCYVYTDSLQAITKKDYNYIVVDFGDFPICKKDLFFASDHYIVTCGSRPWEYDCLLPLFKNLEANTLNSILFCFMFASENAKMQKQIREAMAPNRNIYFPPYHEHPLTDDNVYGIEDYLRGLKIKGGLFGLINKKKNAEAAIKEAESMDTNKVETLEQVIDNSKNSEGKQPSEKKEQINQENHKSIEETKESSSDTKNTDKEVSVALDDQVSANENESQQTDPETKEDEPTTIYDNVDLSFVSEPLDKQKDNNEPVTSTENQKTDLPEENKNVIETFPEPVNAENFENIPADKANNEEKKEDLSQEMSPIFTSQGKKSDPYPAKSANNLVEEQKPDKKSDKGAFESKIPESIYIDVNPQDILKKNEDIKKNLQADKVADFMSSIEQRIEKIDPVEEEEKSTEKSAESIDNDSLIEKEKLKEDSANPPLEVKLIENNDDIIEIKKIELYDDNYESEWKSIDDMCYALYEIDCHVKDNYANETYRIIVYPMEYKNILPVKIVAAITYKGITKAAVSPKDMFSVTVVSNDKKFAITGKFLNEKFVANIACLDDDIVIDEITEIETVMPKEFPEKFPKYAGKMAKVGKERVTIYPIDNRNSDENGCCGFVYVIKYKNGSRKYDVSDQDNLAFVGFNEGGKQIAGYWANPNKQKRFITSIS